MARDLRAEMFLARPLGAWPHANGFAISRAHSMNRCASGLNVRFLSVMIALGQGVVWSSIGNTLTAGCMAENSDM